MNLARLTTTTHISFDPSLTSDVLILDGREVTGSGRDRVSRFLDQVRQQCWDTSLRGARPERNSVESKDAVKPSPTRSGDSFAQNARHDCAHLFARVDSRNNFPAGAGLASSASGFAALALAASAAAGLKLSEAELSRLARLGSGSACRSVPGGFVEWPLGVDDRSSYAHSIAPADHWDLHDVIALIDVEHKTVGSTEGHAAADTSPLQAARVATAADRLAQARSAVLNRDFAALADVVERDSLMMHAVMITSSPSLMYWQPTTVAIMQAVVQWRANGLAACTTIDAGPNVHVICTAEAAEEVALRLRVIPGVRQVITACAGGPAHLLSSA
jgi:diphosphomevalonate decarboxylase